VVSTVVTSTRVRKRATLKYCSRMGVFSPSGSREVNLFDDASMILIDEGFLGVHLIEDGPEAG
jgi:hypothetical protein